MAKKVWISRSFPAKPFILCNLQILHKVVQNKLFITFYADFALATPLPSIQSECKTNIGAIRLNVERLTRKGPAAHSLTPSKRKICARFAD